MQFRLQSCLLALLAGAPKMASAIQATTDIYYHERTSALPKAMWTFSSQGLSIYSLDGSKELKRLSAADLDCGDSCFYFDVVTDGHKYVWANALHAASNRVDVFSLDTGDYLGGVGVCNTPLDMDYIPNREELWIRCAGSEDSPHLAVIQANSLGAASDEVRLDDERSYGHAVFHSSLGNYGYATGNGNVLRKVDMAQREAVANFTLDQAHAAYDMTYSPANKHVFLRSRVCCTCGFEGADNPSCGRSPGSPGQNIQTGPSAGRTDLNGTCGVGCEGSLADTIGVMEFDTVSETFVGNHQPKVGFGATPEASPDGSHIVLFANDGGQNLRVLRAGVNGQKSTLAFDVDLNFENVPPGLEAISDFVFVNWKGHNLLALATGFDNNLAIVDLSAATPTVSKVSLSSSSAPTGGNGGRMVEWAYGSDYIWVDGSANDEVYVLKLNDDGTVSLERTISNLPSSKIIYVENFAQRANFNLFTTYLADSLKTTTDDSSSAGESSNNNQGNSAQLMADLLASKEEGDDQASTVAIVALVIGSLSLLMNVVGMMIYFSSSNSSGKPFAEPSRAETTERVSDDKTIGSKQVA